MTAKIKLGKTGTSRSRGKEKDVVPDDEVLKLQKELRNATPAFIDYLLKKGFSTSTISRYVKDIMRFEAWAQQENIPLDAISYNDILHYLRGKQENVEQRTISMLCNSIKHYYRYLLAAGIVQHDPSLQVLIKGIRRKRLYDILSKQELENLYHSYQQKDDPAHENQNWYKSSLLCAKRNKVIVGLLVYQGLNATELCRLTVRDIKLREAKIFVAGTRRSNERHMKLEAVQILDMMEYVLKIRPEIQTLTQKQGDLLLLSIGGGERMHNALFILARQLREISGKVKSLRQIRTSVITHWLKNNNLRQVQHLAGHRYISSTESYLANDVDDLLEDIAKFHPIG